MRPATASLLLRNVAFAAQPMPLPRLRHEANPSSSLRAVLRSPEPAAPAGPSAAETTHRDAFERGWEEGRCAGLDRGLAEGATRVDEALASARATIEADGAHREQAASAARAAVVEQFEGICRGFEEAVESRLESLERDAVAIAFEAVCRIVGESEALPDHVARCVRTSMKALRGGGLIRVRMHPSVLARLRETTDGLALSAPSELTEWIADASIDSGGCVFDTDLGSVDARMDIQLSRLRNAWSQAATVRFPEPSEARQ